MTILCNELTLEQINSALLRIQRSIQTDNNNFEQNVAKANASITVNSKNTVQKYDDTALRQLISKLQDDFKSLRSSVIRNEADILKLETILTNIDFRYDETTKEITFVLGDYTKTLQLIDTTYTFSYDDETGVFSIVDNVTGATVFSEVFNDTTYTFTFTNGVLTVHNNLTEEDQTFNFDNRYYTESEIQSLILDKIPTQASASNQLADKAFVNSSIATSTANFQGTVTTTTALSQLTGDDNDYAYLENIDPVTGQVESYDRYKWVETGGDYGHWKYEYTLNNSSYTSEQWAAINSGITCQIVQDLICGCYSCESNIDVYCGSTCKCTINSTTPLRLCANAFKSNATISTTTYPGACCTGTVTKIDVYCGLTCVCCIDNSYSLKLAPNAFNECAQISLTTYPGACCTGTLTDISIEVRCAGTYKCTLGNNTLLDLGCNAFSSEPFTTCTGTVTGIKVYCGTTCKCTIDNSTSLCLCPNAFKTNATISTTTYPGACCTGTVVQSDIADFITMADVDACGYTTCTGTVTGIKVYCDTTCKCTINNATSLCLCANAFKANATISTSTYPGACCKGTVTKITLGTAACTPDSSGNITLPAYPTVNDATITICQGSTCKCSFTLNQSSDVTINLDENTNDYCYVRYCNAVGSYMRPLALGPVCSSLYDGDCNQVFYNNKLVANPANGRAYFGDVSDDTTGWLQILPDSSHQLVINGCAGQQHDLIFRTNNNMITCCSIGMGIGAGNVNRGIFHYCPTSETTSAFQWLQYWNATCEIHNCPIYGELGANNKVVYSCILPRTTSSTTRKYLKICYDKAYCGNSSCIPALFEIVDYTSKYYIWNYSSTFRFYTEKVGSVDNNCATYGDMCAYHSGTSNDNCFWISYICGIRPVITGPRKMEIICDTDEAPDGITFIAPTNRNIYADVYCGNTCVCTLGNMQTPLCLSANAFNENAQISTTTYPGACCTGTVVQSDISNFITMSDVDACGYTTCTGTITQADLAPYCQHDCLVKYCELTSSGDRPILQGSASATDGVICPVYFSGTCPLTFNNDTGTLTAKYLCGCAYAASRVDRWLKTDNVDYPFLLTASASSTACGCVYTAEGLTYNPSTDTLKTCALIYDYKRVGSCAVTFTPATADGASWIYIGRTRISGTTPTSAVGNNNTNLTVAAIGTGMVSSFNIDIISSNNCCPIVRVERTCGYNNTTGIDRIVVTRSGSTWSCYLCVWARVTACSTNDFSVLLFRNQIPSCWNTCMVCCEAYTGTMVFDTGVSTARRIQTNTNIVAGCYVICTSSQAGKAGSLLSENGNLTLSATTPYIQFKNNNYCGTCSARITSCEDRLVVSVNNGTGCTAHTCTSTFCFHNYGDLYVPKSVYGTNGRISNYMLSKADNSGYPTYRLLYEITDWYNAAGTSSNNVPGRGLIGTFTHSRCTGYTGAGQTFVTAFASYGRGSCPITTCMDGRIHLHYSNIGYANFQTVPVILKNESEDKYYLAICVTGSVHNYIFNGCAWNCDGTGTYLTCEICATNASGALPSGWSLCSTGKNVSRANEVLTTCVTSNASYPLVMAASEGNYGNLYTNCSKLSANPSTGLLCAERILLNSSSYSEITLCKNNACPLSLCVESDGTRGIYSKNSSLISWTSDNKTCINCLISYDIRSEAYYTKEMQHITGSYTLIGCICTCGPNNALDLTISTYTANTVNIKALINTSKYDEFNKNNIQITTSNIEDTYRIDGVIFTSDSTTADGLLCVWVHLTNSDMGYINVYNNQLAQCWEPDYYNYSATLPSSLLACRIDIPACNFYYNNAGAKLNQWVYETNTETCATCASCAITLVIGNVNCVRKPTHQKIYITTTVEGSADPINLWIEYMGGYGDKDFLQGCFSGGNCDVVIPARLSSDSDNIYVDFAYCNTNCRCFVSTIYSSGNAPSGLNGNCARYNPYTACFDNTLYYCCWNTSITFNVDDGASQFGSRSIAAKTVSAFCVATTSDVRKKKDIVPYNNGLCDISNLDIISFHYKDETCDSVKHISIPANWTCNLLSGKNHDALRVNDTVGILLSAVKDLSKSMTLGQKIKLWFYKKFVEPKNNKKLKEKVDSFTNK